MSGVDDDTWQLVYTDFMPAQETHREALCTLGNGRFATRGAAEESGADATHYPGTYVAGGYDRLASDVAGHPVVNEDMVNVPNWLCLSLRPEGGEWLNLLAVQILSFRQALDLRRGLLRRECVVRDHLGRETALAAERFVSMHEPQRAAIRWTLTACNWDGVMEVTSGLDGSVVNGGVERYRALNSKHLAVLDRGACEGAGGGIFLVADTVQSHLRIAQVARTRVFAEDAELAVDRDVIVDAESVAEILRIPVTMGAPVRLEKMVTVLHSRLPAISDCLDDARLDMCRSDRFDAHFERHARAWEHLWQRYDVRLDAAAAATQRQLRLHIFHLLQTVSANSVALDAGVPARGLHGEAYRGHVFWDSLFILPFFNYRIPQISRALLLYRHRRLEAARWNAREHGYDGALFPWQSGSTGREESQRLHLNPRSGRWDPDHSHLQYHVNLAIAYDIWRYFQVTGDVDFMNLYGDEMVLDIARFWASIARLDETSGRYAIRGVMGPDEYHERYPGADRPGIDNNAYTNVMVAWLLEWAVAITRLRTPERRAQLLEQLGLGEPDIARWDDMSRRLTVPVREDGVIEQFEGYDALDEFDWDAYARKYGDIRRLDRILKAEGDSPDRYKVSKQADVLMLFYLFSPEEVKRILGRMGYPIDDTIIERTIRYYQARTCHGSTLSHVVYASVLHRIDPAAAWAQFCEVMSADLFDIQGGTTSEGIHLGAMAGGVDIVFRHYAGVTLRAGGLHISPTLPDRLTQLHLKLRYRGHLYTLDARRDGFSLAVDSNHPRPLVVDGERRRLGPDEVQRFGAAQEVVIPASD